MIPSSYTHIESKDQLILISVAVLCLPVHAVCNLFHRDRGGYPRLHIRLIRRLEPVQISTPIRSFSV
jgi:hypothetical protein